MQDDISYARCKACDQPFYPQWNYKHRQFEELCWICLPMALGNEVDKGDRDFLEGFLLDKEIPDGD